MGWDVFDDGIDDDDDDKVHLTCRRQPNENEQMRLLDLT